jgi:hypothetical protein
MKNLLLVISAFALMVSCSNKAQEYIAYNDAVVSQVELADSTIRRLFSFADFDEFPKVQQNYHSSFKSINSALTAIEPNEESDSLRLVAMDLVSTYDDIVDNDFLVIYELMSDSLYTAQDSITVDSLSAEMYAKWQIKSEHFASTQKAFSKKFGIELVQ